MADYSRAELLNEVSQIFRAGLNPGVEGGTLNTAVEYQQLLELASTTFLFSTDAVFYLARLAANRLNVLILQETAILEDLLVLLEDLSKVGSAVRDSTTLNNARTTVLSLDAATSVTGRPETQRFTRQMDQFANQVKPNVVSQERGDILVRPREESRNLIQTNLTRLSPLHARLLTQISSLQNVLVEFLALDIPSRVSTTVLLSISDRLDEASSQVDETTDTENLEINRDLFLQTLANKVSVNLLGTFTDPSEFKFRSPNRPIPSTAKHTGRVVGTGDAASVLTSAGPWALPVSAPLQLSISGAAPVTVNLDTIIGSFLSGRNPETFEIVSGNKLLHVVVDPVVYSGTSTAGSTTSSVELSGFNRLGFKHLGSVLAFPDASAANPTDMQLRFLDEMRSLQTFAAGSVVGSNQLNVPSFTASDEGAIGFQQGHVGAYVVDTAGQRFEIISVQDANNCTTDYRNLTPNFTSGGTLRGQFSAGTGTTVFTFLPSMVSAPQSGDRVQAGPATKVAELALGSSRTVSQVITDIQNENGPFDALNDGSALNWHVDAEALVNSSPAKLALRVRSKLNPYAQVSGRFLNPPIPVGPAVVEDESSHVVLGLLEGETDEANTLSPAELVETISTVSGLAAEVVTTEVLGGTSLQTLHTLSRVEDTGIDFAAQGVAVGDQVEVFDGVGAGVYQITGIPSSDQLDLNRDPFSSSEAVLSYRVFREQVKISTTDSGPSTSLEVVSTPSELGLSLGIVYSSIPQFEAVDKLGSKLRFTGVVPGDLLRIVGNPTEHPIVEVQNETLLLLESGVPSNTLSASFEIKSAAARSFEVLSSRLETYVTSPNLLQKNNFDENVDAIDNAVTAAILPGRNFPASRNQARRMVSDLLSILTEDLQRSDEYLMDVPSAADTLDSILDDYTAPAIAAIDDYLDSLLERKYDRAASLLQQGRLEDFYATTEETGSFGGAVMAGSRAAVNDLPRESRTRYDFLGQRDIASSDLTTTDADFDFSDIDAEPESPFE